MKNGQHPADGALNRNTLRSRSTQENEEMQEAYKDLLDDFLCPDESSPHGTSVLNK